MNISFSDWFKSNVASKLKNDFELKYIADSDSVLGNMEGVQIDSDKIGGHIYFYDNGYYNLFLYDMINDKDLLPIETIKSNDDHSKSCEKILTILIEYT